MAALLAGAAMAFASCSGGDTEPRPGGEPTSTSAAPTSAAATPRPKGVVGAITAFDQVGDGATIVVNQAELHGMAGYVVVHAEEAEGPGAVVGHAAIPEGVSDNVVVTLDSEVPPGPYWLMLHRDGGAVGIFEWPGPDGPVRPPVGLTYATKRIMVSKP